MPFGRGIRRPSKAPEHLLRRVRVGRTSGQGGPNSAIRSTSDHYPTVTTTATGLSRMVSEIDSEPRLFDVVRREAQLTPVPSRSAPAERHHVGSGFYLLLVGLVATAIIGAFFGIAFSLLTQPKDKTVVGAGLVSPAAEEAVSTRGTTSPGEPRATTDTSAKTALAPDSTLPAPGPPAPPLQVNSSPAVAKFTGVAGEPTRSESASSRSRAHSATRGGRSAHHNQQPAAQTEKQRVLSAAMDRAHRQNFSDAFPTLTPPRAGARNPFDVPTTDMKGRQALSRP